MIYKFIKWLFPGYEKLPPDKIINCETCRFNTRKFNYECLLGHSTKFYYNLNKDAAYVAPKNLICSDYERQK